MVVVVGDRRATGEARRDETRTRQMTDGAFHFGPAKHIVACSVFRPPVVRFPQTGAVPQNGQDGSYQQITPKPSTTQPLSNLKQRRSGGGGWGQSTETSQAPS